MTPVRYFINGQSFFARTWGTPDKPLVLMLHGFPEYSGAWDEVATLLSDRFYCVAPDQRGYGQSWRPQEVEAYEARHLTRDAIATLQHFGASPAFVVGHDWGATIAYALAIGAPELVSRLIVLNGVHPVPFQRALAAGGAQSTASQYITWMRGPGAAEALAENDFARLMNLFSAKMDLSWMTETRAAEYRAAWRDADGLRAMINWYRASPLRVAQPGHAIPDTELPSWDADRLRVRMPHLVIWGQRDTALLPETREGLSDFCDDLRVIEHPDADHWIAHQVPMFVADQITTFLLSHSLHH